MHKIIHTLTNQNKKIKSIVERYYCLEGETGGGGESLQCHLPLPTF
jgi:hypothetical protein